MPLVSLTSTTAVPPDTALPPQGYAGTSPFPPDGPAPAHSGGERLYATVTGLGVTIGFHRVSPTGVTGPCISRSRWPGR